MMGFETCSQFGKITSLSEFIFIQLLYYLIMNGILCFNRINVQVLFDFLPVLIS